MAELCRDLQRHPPADHMGTFVWPSLQFGLCTAQQPRLFAGPPPHHLAALFDDPCPTQRLRKLQPPGIMARTGTTPRQPQSSHAQSHAAHFLRAMTPTKPCPSTQILKAMLFRWAFKSTQWDKHHQWPGSMMPGMVPLTMPLQWTTTCVICKILPSDSASANHTAHPAAAFEPSLRIFSVPWPTRSQQIPACCRASWPARRTS